MDQESVFKSQCMDNVKALSVDNILTDSWQWRYQKFCEYACYCCYVSFCFKTVVMILTLLLLEEHHNSVLRKQLPIILKTTQLNILFFLLKHISYHYFSLI